MNKILLVDDDIELCALLKEYLQNEGFEVTVAHDGQKGLELTHQNLFDLIILDVMMPVLNGLDTLRRIRASQTTPVIMLTAKGETVDRIVGLEMGADDYLPKPCNPRELTARINAILRRNDAGDKPQEDELEVDDLFLHTRSHSVFFRKKPVTLTGAEFTVLELLMRAAGEVISKELLTERALNRKLTPYDRSIDVHVSNIRKKLSADGANKDLIINIRGAGYMLTRTKA